MADRRRARRAVSLRGGQDRLAGALAPSSSSARAAAPACSQQQPAQGCYPTRADQEDRAGTVPPEEWTATWKAGKGYWATEHRKGEERKRGESTQTEPAKIVDREVEWPLGK